MTDGTAPRYEPIVVSSESTVVAEFIADPSQESGYQSEAELERTFIALLRDQAYEYLPLTSEGELIANLRIQLEAHVACIALRLFAHGLTDSLRISNDLVRYFPGHFFICKSAA